LSNFRFKREGIVITVVVCYGDKYLTIIMSDDRVNCNIFGRHIYEDGHTKLVELPNMGWASGAGLSDFLETFKKELSKSTVFNIEEMGSIYKKILEKSKKNRPDLSSFISKSAIVVSWVAVLEDELYLRFGVFEEENFDTEIAVCEFGNYLVLYPGDYLDDQDKIKNVSEKYLNYDNSEEESYEKILSRMFSIFNEISSNSEQCSTHCDVGIQVVQPTGIYKIKFGGEIKELILLLDEEKLDEKYELVQAIEFKNN